MEDAPLGDCAPDTADTTDCTKPSGRHRDRAMTLRAIAERLRKIIWLERTPCDVVIFDAVGSDELRHCMPSRARVNTLRTREGLALVKSLRIIPILVASLLKYRKPGLALVVSIVRIWKPKVIITYIDNTPAMGVLKQIFPGTQMISVQNGTRWDLSLPNQPHLDFDHYFSFGQAENDIFAVGGHSAVRVHPVGSLRAGIFVETIPAAQDNTFDICHISGFAPLRGIDPDRSRAQIHSAYFETDKRLFRTIVQFSRANNLKLCVAMRFPTDNAAFEEERRYFSLDDASQVCAIPRSPYSSYKAVRSSRLSTTISSSLGYEALGLGARVIFAKDVKAVSSLVTEGAWTTNLVTHRLPESQRLHSLEYGEFSSKATALLNMTDEEYINHSKDARAYYMNIDMQRLPQQIIRQSIEEFLARPA